MFALEGDHLLLTCVDKSGVVSAHSWKGARMAQFRLRGNVSAGMFPQERILVLTDHQGRKYTLIVSDDQVHEDGTITVHMLDEQGEAALVRLPGELIEAGRTLSVARGALLPA